MKCRRDNSFLFGIYRKNTQVITGFGEKSYAVTTVRIFGVPVFKSWIAL